MIAVLLDKIYDKYSRVIARIFDTGSNFAYWSFKISWYLIPTLISVIILGILIFSLTWIFYLLFYIYYIPPKSITFPLNFEYKNNFLSQFYIDDGNTSSKSIFGSGNIYNNVINNDELTNQLLYEQSEAVASVSFDNITWKLGKKDNGVISPNNKTITVQDSSSFNKYSITLDYLIYFKNYTLRKIYNLFTFNWFGKRNKSNNSEINNIINNDILGNEIDILVELFYYPNKYNINITPFQVNIELIKCIESDNSDSLSVLAEFRKTATIEYTPDIIIRFREYFSLIPSLFGIKISCFGLGLENKITVKLVENFPLLKKYYHYHNNTNTHLSNYLNGLIKLCGANIKMKPALHAYKANLIFQTKLKFWKEVIRNHPILMGNILSIMFTLFCLILIFLISISIGFYLLWKKHSINNYCDMHISNSHLPTGTVTHNICTPSSTYHHINSNDIGKGLSLGTFRENKFAIDYSSSSTSPVIFNGLLPLETRQVITNNSKNQYLLESTFTNRNEVLSNCQGNGTVLNNTNLSQNGNIIDTTNQNDNGNGDGDITDGVNEVESTLKIEKYDNNAEN
ncbi:hypothetical protein RS030_3476 [Cryptosporidium xiaoi]|uniref:Uncharacterized protein n=1 Tax=Cryptosporidium xiaoi TaxID=659607 RepID=A0AAV9XVX2_9CRYT